MDRDAEVLALKQQSSTELETARGGTAAASGDQPSPAQKGACNTAALEAEVAVMKHRCVQLEQEVRPRVCTPFCSG
jgi:hypothetical protein